MVWRLVEKFHVEIVVDLDKCCVHVKKCRCICCLCRFYYCRCCCCVEHLSFVFFSCVFSWFLTGAATSRTVVCVSIKCLINSSFERISLRWHAKFSRSNLLFLTPRWARVFHASSKTKNRKFNLLSKINILQFTWQSSQCFTGEP